MRNEFQKDLTAEEVARRNHEYLLGSTNYLRRGEILRFAGRYFEDARFVENVVLATSPRATRILGGPLVGAAALAFGGLYMRVLACRSPR